jgi:hypothetical protein
MRTRRIGIKKHKKRVTRFKIYKGGRSSGSNKSSDKGSAAASSPKRVSPKAVSPKAAASSPKRVSPKAAAASPKRVSPLSPKFAQRVVPVGRLKGRGRSRALSYHANIHSQGDSVPESIKEGLANKVRDVFDLTPSPDTPTKRSRIILERRIRASTPPPPSAELSPRGRGLLTSYTPTLDIVEDGTRIPIVDKPLGTAKGYQMKPFVYRHSHPLPLSFMTKKQTSLKSRDDYDMMSNLGTFPSTYKFLSPIIYDILKRINKRDLFGKVLVLGKLRDELAECMNITSIEAMESRLFMSREDATAFMEYIHGGHTVKQAIGPTPYDPIAADIADIGVITPDSNPPPPTSLQVVGYNRHPMFRADRFSREEEAKLVELSDRHKGIRGEDYAFVMAHGALTNELSPDVKLLANKYLRIIEMGKAGQILSVIYHSFVIEVNKILRNPRYHAMFDNNKEGARTRSEVFNILCPYFVVDNVSLCKASDTFNLTDITHDRIFSGHVNDINIKEDHKITYKSLKNMISMGIFSPVDYNLDKSTPQLARKELFKLYPGTTFLSSNTSMRLIETLLPIAIQQNRRINIVIMSCAVNYVEGDDVYENIGNGKPGNINPAIETLTLSKKYLSRINKLMDDYVIEFYKDGVLTFNHNIFNGKDVFTGYRNYVSDGKYNELFSIAQHLIDFNLNKYLPFRATGYTSSDKIDEMFSFSGLNSNSMSNRLIEHRNPLRNDWYYPYVDEMIKVKIFTMTEFKNVCSIRIGMIKSSLDIIMDNIRALRTMYGPGPFFDAGTISVCDMLDEAIRSGTAIYNYFHRLAALADYIDDGLSSEPSNPNSFMDYKKYVDIRKEYYETRANEIYEELVEDLDYDRYEGENVGFGERVYKARLVNPLPPTSRFRKTSRYPYKHKILHDYDEIRERRKTTKKQLYDKLRVGKHARKAKRSSGVSV